MCADLGLGRVVLDAHGVARVFRCEAVDLAVERGGEEERLALPANLADDAVDGRAEAQVEHAVGLVEHEQGDAVEADEAPLEQILEPARRGHEDVGARGLLGLAVDADSAEGRGDAQAAGARDGRGLLGDLHGELARRHQHEAGRNARVAADALGHRDREGQRLAAAGRRFREDVAPCQCVGKDELLDGEGSRDAALQQRSAHVLGRAKGAKGLGTQVFNSWPLTARSGSEDPTRTPN